MRVLQRGDGVYLNSFDVCFNNIHSRETSLTEVGR